MRPIEEDIYSRPPQRLPAEYPWVYRNDHGRIAARRVDAPEPADLGVTQQTYTIPWSHSHVIGALFSHPEVVPAPRQITWVDFTRTMMYLGFSVQPNKGGGAVYRFSVRESSAFVPENRSGNVFIVHRPHRNKGAALVLESVRRTGATLNQLFGWDSKTFKFT
jgi:hypothetical protein